MKFTRVSAKQKILLKTYRKERRMIAVATIVAMIVVAMMKYYMH